MKSQRKIQKYIFKNYFMHPFDDISENKQNFNILKVKHKLSQIRNATKT